MTSLKKQFSKAARVTLAGGLSGLAMLLGGCSDKAPPQEKPAPSPVQPVRAKEPLYIRSLTAGEQQLAQTLFNSKVDTSNVTIHVFQNENSNNPTFVNDGEQRVITVNGERYSSPDYSGEKDVFLYGAFVHELTRLWQHQNAETWVHNPNNLDYRYNLDSRLSFGDYGRFHQASIIEDYARRFFHPVHRAGTMESTFGPMNCDADNFLAHLVEKQFPHLTEVRQKIERKNTRLANAAEINFARNIFGNEVNFSNVKVHQQPRSCGGRPQATVNSSQDIHFWGADRHRTNYTETDTKNFAVFAHEATHIWQWQNNIGYKSWENPNKPHYPYPLDLRKWGFNDYGIEQQGAIIQDYTGYFLHAGRQAYWLRAQDAETPRNLAMLKALVENRFPAAKKTREYFEAYGKLPVYEAPQTQAALSLKP